MSLVQDHRQAPALPTKRARVISGTSCHHCGTTHTPLWRRGPNEEPLCNACGLYYRSRGKLRPLNNKKPKKAPAPAVEACEGSVSCPGNGHCNGQGGALSCRGCPALNQRARPNYTCANCSATTTPLWRRDTTGAPICNACGLYFKMHGTHRPVTMMRATIKRRNRMGPGDDEEVTAACQDPTDVSSTATPTPPPAKPVGVGITVRRHQNISLYSRRPKSLPLSPGCPSPSPSANVSWLDQVNLALVNPDYKSSSEPNSSSSSDHHHHLALMTPPEVGPSPHSPRPPAGLNTTPEPQWSSGSLLVHRQELQREIDRLDELRCKYMEISNNLSSIISRLP